MVSLSSSLLESFHTHAQKELEASLLFLQAHHWFKVRHYDGFAERIESFGEKHREYHKKFLDYITLRGGEVSVRASPLPSMTCTEELPVYEYFLELEESYYGKLKELFAQARGENDFAAEAFIESILEEQVVRCDDWEEDVFKMRGYVKTAGLIWLYNSSH